MTVWTAEMVTSADERENNIAQSSTRIETPEFLLFVVPGSYALTYVRRFQCDGDRAEATIDDILGRVKTAGGDGLRWVVNSRSLPADLDERLLGRGFTKLAAAETLYLVLGPKGEPPLRNPKSAGAITSREVFSDEEIDQFTVLGQRIFGDPAPPPDYQERFRGEVRRYIESTGHSELFLSFEGAVPVARGGLSVTGVVGRLWSAGVLSEHRGKGAYMALTVQRCKSAVDQGAEIALTHAKVGTSGPILKAHGFQTAGDYTYYELQTQQ
jgi:hypothetical protein